MKDFDWSRISFWFPEFDPTEACKPKHSPECKNGVINFSMENKYGGQIFLNQETPQWISDNQHSSENQQLALIYRGLCGEVYQQVLNELTESMPIFKKWRTFISKFNGREWVGQLQNNLSFGNSSGGVNMGDYYSFYNVSESEHPTDKLHLIGKLPKKLLNEQGKKYHRIAQNVFKTPKGRSNLISGKNLIDCIKNADEIYTIANELKQLEL